MPSLLKLSVEKKHAGGHEEDTQGAVATVVPQPIPLGRQQNGCVVSHLNNEEPVLQQEDISFGSTPELQVGSCHRLHDSPLQHIGAHTQPQQRLIEF
jgi:hypothetical protein